MMPGFAPLSTRVVSPSQPGVYHAGLNGSSGETRYSISKNHVILAKVPFSPASLTPGFVPLPPHVVSPHQPGVYHAGLNGSSGETRYSTSTNHAVLTNNPFSPASLTPGFVPLPPRVSPSQPGLHHAGLNGITGETRYSTFTNHVILAKVPFSPASLTPGFVPLPTRVVSPRQPGVYHAGLNGAKRPHGPTGRVAGSCTCQPPPRAAYSVTASVPTV